MLFRKVKSKKYFSCLLFLTATRKARTPLEVQAFLIPFHQAPREMCPMWGGTSAYHISCSAFSRFQFTHPVRGGTITGKPHGKLGLISIHPPHAGWDEEQAKQAGATLDFNPPTPCGVGLPRSALGLGVEEFQSTHPVRGGTIDLRFFQRVWDISIHPPRAGWDAECLYLLHKSRDFNPPTPCGVGPRPPAALLGRRSISIHPPRAGWDNGN